MRLPRLTWAGGGLAFTAVAALMPPSPLRALLLVSFTGWGAAALSGRRWTFTGLVLASLAWGLPLWGLISLAGWACGLADYLPWLAVALDAVLLGGAAFARLPLHVKPFRAIDAWAWLAMLVIGVPLITIQQVNGPQGSPGQERFEARLFISHDSMYAFSLAQSALDHQEYPRENPLMAGAPNAYPSLLHCGLGGLTGAGGDVAALVLWPIYPWITLPGIGLVVLALWRWSPRRSRLASALLGVGYIIFLCIRPDHFIYLQTQAFTMPLFGLLLHAWPGTAARTPWRRWILFGLLQGLLIAAHTVTAVAGLALIAGAGFRYLQRHRPRLALRQWPTVLAVASLAGFFLMNNHYRAEPLHSPPSWPDVFNLAWVHTRGYYVPFFVGLLALALRLKKPWHPWAIAALLLLACTMGYWLNGMLGGSFSTIFFGLFNAARFALNGLMFSLIFAVIQTRKSAVIYFLLGLNGVFIQPEVVPDLPQFITAEPNSYSISQIRQARKDMPQNTGVYKHQITDVPYSAVSAFTAYSNYNPVTPFFALGTVDEMFFEMKRIKTLRFFRSYSPQQRLQFARDNDISVVVLERNNTDAEFWNAFLPPGSAEIHPGPEWIIFTLKNSH